MKKGIIALIIVVALGVTGIYVASSRNTQNDPSPSFADEVKTPEPEVNLASEPSIQETPEPVVIEPTPEPTPEPTVEPVDDESEIGDGDLSGDETQDTPFYDYMDPTPGEITVDDVRVFYNTYCRDEVASYGLDPDYFDANAYTYWDSDDRATYCNGLEDGRTFTFIVTFKDGRIVDYYLDVDYLAG